VAHSVQAVVDSDLLVPTLNLRRSLSNWLVEPKTVQGILRHAKIQTTLDLYAQEQR
jgi:hypothetical protein